MSFQLLKSVDDAIFLCEAPREHQNQNELSQQPGATTSGDAANKNHELEEMRKLLAAKDAEIAALRARAEKSNDDSLGTLGANDEESKRPPKTDVTLSIRGVPEYDSFPYAMASDKFYFMASIKAPYFREEHRSPIDLVAVVDESGSMGGDRIRLLKETVQFVIKNLESGDRFGLIGYSSGSREVLPLTAMDSEGKKKATELTATLRASGGTALCKGLVHGVNMMRQRTFKNDIASVMILTDGQANQGPTTAQQINRSVCCGKVLSVQYGSARCGEPQRSATAATAASDDETKQPEGGGPGIFGEELPCTINTFGFGVGHNEQLLRAIAENGRGIYSFIETTDQISHTFAECLGGLVSIIGQNLSVRVQALNEVEITRCLSKGYSQRVEVPGKRHSISVKDLQSEESREFIFELKVPAISGAKEADPMVQLAVNYLNVVKGATETLTNIATIHRIEGQQIGERNLELDLQYNRVLAAEAMAEAEKLAKRGKLGDARKVLGGAQQHILQSKTKGDAYCVHLVSDLSRLQSNMRDQGLYQSTGSRTLTANMMSHQQQRSCQSRRFDSSSQAFYCNRSKSKMMSKLSTK